MMTNTNTRRTDTWNMTNADEIAAVAEDFGLTPEDFAALVAEVPPLLAAGLDYLEVSTRLIAKGLKANTSTVGLVEDYLAALSA